MQRLATILLCIVSVFYISTPAILMATGTENQQTTVEKPKRQPRHKYERVASQKDKQTQAAEEAKTPEKPAEPKPAEKPVEASANKDAKPAGSEGAVAAQAGATAEKDKKPQADEKKADEKKPVKCSVVVLTIKGNYPEGNVMPGLFSELQPSLSSVISRMDAAVKDKDVAAVWLKINDLAIGRAKIHELRAAIARLRKAGKPVYAELTTAESREYLVASACDKIIMPSSGMLIIPGVRAEITFFKGLLDKLGLKFEAMQMGKYKGAAEPLTRNEMSKPLRESYEALIDDAYDDLVSTIAADRKLPVEQVKQLIDKGIFTPGAAQKAGLIDKVSYADEFQESLKEMLKANEVSLITDYKKKRIDTDFSGITGMMKLMELLMGQKTAATTSKKDKIAVIYAVGPIVEGRGTTDIFSDSVVGSNAIVTALKKAADDPKVVAIVLRIDSPGGSATASDLIWREMVRIGKNKPIIASMGDVAASGGYYIAMGARKIVASPGTITGSIGVIGGKLVLQGLYDKVGIKTEVISRGANSGALSPSQPFTPEERKAWTELLEDVYKQFVSKAAAGRNMPVEKLEALAQGRVYTGRMAQKIGLVDEIGTLDDAITSAKTTAGLKSGADVELMVLPEPKSIFEQLFGDSNAIGDLDSMLPEGFKVLRQGQTLRQMLSERILLWMPYSVEVK